MTVREASAGDAEAIAALLTELGYPTAPDVAAERLAALGDHDRVLLAGDGAGLIALHRIPRLAEGGAFTRITALVVTPDHRGRGTARSLLEAAEDIARVWGCDLIEVSSGRRPERNRAHDIYAAAGFTDTTATSTRYDRPLPPRGQTPRRN
jgi:GNAT superfamily N-acetyltransferase